jgi:hypothetical protein
MINQDFLLAIRQRLRENWFVGGKIRKIMEVRHVLD